MAGVLSGGGALGAPSAAKLCPAASSTALVVRKRVMVVFKRAILVVKWETPSVMSKGTYEAALKADATDYKEFRWAMTQSLGFELIRR